jgi:hypothetical protein
MRRGARMRTIQQRYADHRIEITGAGQFCNFSALLQNFGNFQITCYTMNAAP